MNRLLRLPEVLSRVGLRRSAWYELIANGLAPAPVAIGARAVAWPETSIESWIGSRRQKVSPVANARRGVEMEAA